MDFVKREDQNVFDDENYKVYMDSLQKSQLEDYHTPISMEQLHQAMQTSLSSTMVHNFQIPLSPRQMSTLMLKTNSIRSLNFNEIPAHLSRNLSNDIDFHLNDIQGLRHEDLIGQTLSRNLDISLIRSLGNELDLQNATQINYNLTEQDLSRSLGELPQNLRELPQNLRDIPQSLRDIPQSLRDIPQSLRDLPQNLRDLPQNLRELPQNLRDLPQNLRDLPQNIRELPQNIRDLPQTLRDLPMSLRDLPASLRDLPHDLNHEIDLSHHLGRQSLESEFLTDERRTPIVSITENHLLEANLNHAALSQRLDQNITRLDPTLNQRIEVSIGQRIDRLDQRLVSNMALQDRQLDVHDHSILPMQFQIKAEQEDEYFYENVNQGLNNVNVINGTIHQEQAPQTTHNEPNQMYVYNNHMQNMPPLAAIDLYTRPQNYIQNYATRDNPQNLVIHKQFENEGPYPDPKQETKEEKEPKENLKPTENKGFYNELNVEDKDDMLNIKGEYFCFKCNEIFPTKRGLKQHMKGCVEDGENFEKIGKYACSLCAYRCMSPAILKIHERKHTGVKPFSCNFCSYKSGQKNNVAKHILVHMKEKPFKCQYCPYRCAQKNNLVVHERTHTGYKPFACTFCDYRTVQKPNLVKHMYLHTDQKPFSCDMCSYRCVQKTNLTKHKQRHLNDKEGDRLEKNSKIYKPRQKSVKCPHCSYRCVQKSSMDKHLQFKHGDEIIKNSDEVIENSEDVVLNDDVIETSGEEIMKNEEVIQNLSVRKDSQEKDVAAPT